MNIKPFIFLAIAVTSIANPVRAVPSVKKVGDSVVDSEALNLGEEKYGNARFSKRINGCSFQQDAITTHKGYQYVGYYDGSRRVCIARRPRCGECDLVEMCPSAQV